MGAGVIIATAFIHLLDPAYSEIGPQTCVGMTGGWAVYSWPPALAMSAVMLTFFLDFGAEQYVERVYGLPHAHGDIERTVTDAWQAGDRGNRDAVGQPHQHLHSGDQDNIRTPVSNPHKLNLYLESPDTPESTERAFYQQIAAFLVLEFGVIFHSVIVGLNLGVAGPEFSTLYPVIVFHQAFEFAHKAS